MLIMIKMECKMDSVVLGWELLGLLGMENKEYGGLSVGQFKEGGYKRGDVCASLTITIFPKYL